MGPWGSCVPENRRVQCNDTDVLGVRSSTCFPMDSCCCYQGKACLAVL